MEGEIMNIPTCDLKNERDKIFGTENIDFDISEEVQKHDHANVHCGKKSFTNNREI